MTYSYYVNHVRLSGGLALWWTDAVDVLRRSFWRNIGQIIGSIDAPAIVIGDFNLIGEIADKMGGNQHISKSIEELQTFISNANLLEVPFKGVKYTWSNNREEAHHIRERIDCALVNADWMDLYPQKPQRGLRQGDPISPYLFLIVADVLSRSISNAIQNGILSGIKVARDCPTVSHIFFADDSMLISQASEEAARNINILLQDYCLASGQKIKYHKSSVLFSPNLSSELKNKVIDILGISESSGKGGRWNLNKLKEYVSDQSVSEISSIPISRIDANDCLVSHFDSRGNYTVKSGYYVALHLKESSNQQSSSSSNPSKSFWKLLWSISAPPKLTIFCGSFAQMHCQQRKIFLEENVLARLRVEPRSSRDNYALQWIPPPADSVKFNCDGAFKNGLAAIGILGRDHVGQLFDDLACRVQVVSPLQVELIAIREALLIIHHHLSSAIVESDYKTTVDLLSSDLQSPWSCAVLVDDIKYMTSQFFTVFSFVPRCYNAATN
ncbi:hypothetical protein AgCh_010047 [Apium graveolens]